MLTPLELDIMKAVWARPAATVKDVQSALRPQRKLAYTTVMTLMHRLHLKGYLQRERQGRAHVYEAKIGFSEVRDAEIDRLIRNFFAGSQGDLIGFLEGETAPSNPPIKASPRPDDLDETLL
jgi:BlaI family transcriptional regulator, penicillinase repressor